MGRDSHQQTVSLLEEILFVCCGAHDVRMFGMMRALHRCVCHTREESEHQTLTEAQDFEMRLRLSMSC